VLKRIAFEAFAINHARSQEENNEFLFDKQLERKKILSFADAAVLETRG
jgi:hypothetical protein